jgi:hypothetical protein
VTKLPARLPLRLAPQVLEQVDVVEGDAMTGRARFPFYGVGTAA